MATSPKYLAPPLFLPNGWRFSQWVFEEVKVAETVIMIAGAEATNDENSRSIVGSAGGCDNPESIEARAYYELLERIALITADGRNDTWPLSKDGQTWQSNQASQIMAFPKSPCPEDFQFSLSNGCALGRDTLATCEKATFELVERDALLKSWYGESLPYFMPDLVRCPELTSIRSLYEGRTYAFPSRAIATKHTAVIGVFLFPKESNLPLVYGFGAAFDVPSAHRKALDETWQRLGFLSMDPLPDQEIVFSPTSYYHQEIFLRPGADMLLQRWLSGDQVKTLRGLSDPIDVQFIDLTPKDYGDLRVIKALSSNALPLIFGRHPDYAHDPIYAIHPIA